MGARIGSDLGLFRNTRDGLVFQASQLGMESSGIYMKLLRKPKAPVLTQ